MLVILVVFSAITTCHAHVVPRAQSRLLRTTDGLGRRLVCDATTTPPRIGIMEARTRVSIRYRRVKSGSAFTRALRECKNLIAKRACGDSVDNDGDGTIDYPFDNSCSSPLGTSEGEHSTNPEPAPTQPGPIDAQPTPVGPFGPDPLALLQKPFRGSYAVSNFFDHDVPREFIDANGYVRIASGERYTRNIDGHEGYDFRMPEGTPILAAADGVVTFAGEGKPFVCPILNNTTTIGTFVTVRHVSDVGDYRTIYAHLSRVDVIRGQTVIAGAVLGLSGNTGCSTAPHLHFNVQRRVSSSWVDVDPFGWGGSDDDPWSLQAEGSASRYLWKTDEAPQIYKQTTLPANPGTDDRAAVAITMIRMMGFNDAQNPNNEMVELTLDTRYSNGDSLNLSRFAILNNAGESFTFPQGTILNTGSPISVYSGSGTGKGSILYWGRSTQAWDNNGDCVRLVKPNGQVMYRLSYGKQGCTGIAGSVSAGVAAEDDASEYALGR